MWILSGVIFHILAQKESSVEGVAVSALHDHDDHVDDVDTTKCHSGKQYYCFPLLEI